MLMENFGHAMNTTFAMVPSLQMVHMPMYLPRNSHILWVVGDLAQRFILESRHLALQMPAAVPDPQVVQVMAQ